MKDISKGFNWACGCFVFLVIAFFVVPLVFFGGACAWIVGQAAQPSP